MHVKSPDELKVELQEQIAALRASAAAYDGGAFWEAKRLASTAYILLHDGSANSKSLLGQLGLKATITLLSTARPQSADPVLPLAVLDVSMVEGWYRYSPNLDRFSEAHHELPFSKWYSETVFETGSGKSVSRKNLIFSLRNQLGGGHVDPTLKDEAVHWLAQGAHNVSFGPTTDENGNPIQGPSIFAEMKDGPVPNGHLATMRQVAWELEKSLVTVGLVEPVRGEPS